MSDHDDLECNEVTGELRWVIERQNERLDGFSADLERARSVAVALEGELAVARGLLEKFQQHMLFGALRQDGTVGFEPEYGTGEWCGSIAVTDAEAALLASLPEERCDFADRDVVGAEEHADYCYQHQSFGCWDQRPPLTEEPSSE